MKATMDNMRQVFKIDITTGDVITPRAVEYSYNLMFEDRAISIWTYNLETLLAEKLETIMARSTANTRMRDFYDIHVIGQQETFDAEILKKAFNATSEKRNTARQIPDFRNILLIVESDDAMRKQWERFRESSFFVGDLTWDEIMGSVKDLSEIIL